jgi:hypothetical protein
MLAKPSDKQRRVPLTLQKHSVNDWAWQQKALEWALQGCRGLPCRAHTRCTHRRLIDLRTMLQQNINDVRVPSGGGSIQRRVPIKLPYTRTRTAFAPGRHKGYHMIAQGEGVAL